MKKKEAMIPKKDGNQRRNYKKFKSKGNVKYEDKEQHNEGKK